MRTCDATGSCIAVPDTPHYRKALRKGDTLGRRRPHIHWIRKNKVRWIEERKKEGWHIAAVELADDATSLPQLQPARHKTILVLGHEHNGVPDEAWLLLDEAIEIPMVGQGASLNVAVAGSLVLYRLAALS